MMKYQFGWRRANLLATSFIFLIFTSGLFAQTIEEVVVTAQKRSESLQDVPISIRAFTGENLHELGISNSEDVLKLIPGGGILPQGGSKQNYFIRGVGTSDFHVNVVGAVGVYLDDVAINSPAAVSFSTFDTERVEILRGPQNTLFGRNTTGGAVNYVSRKPSIEDGLNGYVRAGYGRYDQVDAEGAIGIALGDKAAVRLSVISNQRDGVFDNITTGDDEGSTDRLAFRGQILLAPNDDWEILASYRYGRNRSDPRPYKMVGLLDPNDLTMPCPVPADQIIAENVPLCSDSLGNTHQVSDWEEVVGGFPHKEKIDAHGGTLRISWDTGFATVTSISAYDQFELDFGEDSDGSPTIGFQFYQVGEWDTYSQELRVVSPDDQNWRWMAGFYYFLEEAVYNTTVRRIPAPFAPSGVGVFNTVPNTQVDQDNEVFSGFGQVEYDLQDNLTATAGFRWTNETKKGVNAASVRCAGNIFGPPFCPRVSERVVFTRDLLNSLPVLFALPPEPLNYDESEWGARFSVDYRINEDVLLYGSISRGFKGGGFSIAPLQAFLGNAAAPVEPEVLTAYEGGFKSTWMDGSLQVNGAVYYYEWDNLQAFQPTLDPAAGIVVPQLINFPEASMVGGELEIQWAFGEGWYLAGGINVNEGEFDDVGNIVGAAAGNKLPNNPDFSHTGLLRKEFRLAEGVFALQANWRYKGDVAYDFANSKNLSQDGYWQLSARGSYSFGANEAYQVSVWGNNLTGEEYCFNRGSLEGLVESLICQAELSEPTFGVTAQYNF